MSNLPLDRGSEHYKGHGIEPIEYILSHKMGFCRGNVIKYVTRAPRADSAEKAIDDLNKAKHYIDFIIANIESKRDS